MTDEPEPRLVFGVDPGNANAGWAVVEEGTKRVHALGKITTPNDKAIDLTTNYLRRSHAVAVALRDVFAGFHWAAAGRIVIVSESLLMHGMAQSVVSNALPHGAVAMLAATYGVELSVASPARWQRAIIGTTPRAPKRMVVASPPAPKVRAVGFAARLAVIEAAKAIAAAQPKLPRKSTKTDHAVLYRRLGEYVARNGLHDAHRQLADLGAVTDANHALDALGVAIYRAAGQPCQIIATQRNIAP